MAVFSSEGTAAEAAAFGVPERDVLSLDWQWRSRLCSLITDLLNVVTASIIYVCVCLALTYVLDIDSCSDGSDRRLASGTGSRSCRSSTVPSGVLAGRSSR